MSTPGNELAPSDDLIAFAVTEAFGERCPTTDGDCYTCQAWAQYDRLAATRPDAGAVKIKPLEWTEETYSLEDGEIIGWTSDAPFETHYHIKIEADGFHLWFCSRSFGVFDNEEAAKSAAQADYEQRIRSALSFGATTVSSGDDRGAFRAGWYVNAIEAGDEEGQQPASYLAGCEEVDWQAYKAVIAALELPAKAAGDGVREALDGEIDKTKQNVKKYGWDTFSNEWHRAFGYIAGLAHAIDLLAREEIGAEKTQGKQS